MTGMFSATKLRRGRRDLDLIVRKILSALQENGRLTIQELAKRVDLSSSPCWTRAKRFEVSGVIEGYTAMVNTTALGLCDIVFVEITLEKHDDKVLERFGAALARIVAPSHCS